MGAGSPQRGFILIELAATIVLVGIIGSFTVFFLYTGVQGYMRAKATSEGALRAQAAIMRIAKELRDLDSLNGNPVPNTSIAYTGRTLPGLRQISYAGGVISMVVNDADYPLLKGVDSFSLSWQPADLDNDGNDEIAWFEVGFTAGEIQKDFTTRVYPRRFLPAP